MLKVDRVPAFLRLWKVEGMEVRLPKCLATDPQKYLEYLHSASPTSVVSLLILRVSGMTSEIISALSESRLLMSSVLTCEFIRRKTLRISVSERFVECLLSHDS